MPPENDRRARMHEAIGLALGAAAVREIRTEDAQAVEGAPPRTMRVFFIDDSADRGAA